MLYHSQPGPDSQLCEETSSKRMGDGLSQHKPGSTNLVLNTAATFATTDSSYQTNVPDKINDSTAQPSLAARRRSKGPEDKPIDGTD